MTEPLYVSPAEAARLLSVHRSYIYRMLTDGKLTARKEGRRTLVEVASIKAYAESLPAWSPEKT